MLRLVTAKEMREIDRRTIEDVGVPSLLLMENAGLGVTEIVEEVLEEIDGYTVTILCGKGNNGGDGFVVARHLFNRGYQVNVYLAGVRADLKGDAKINATVLDGFKIQIRPLTTKAQLKAVKPGDVVIDALLGTGVTGEVTGFLAEVIKWVNRCASPVIAVDLPSGLHSDDGSFQGACIMADYTGTMAEVKRGLVIPPGRELAGEVTVVDIGAPEFVSRSVGGKTYWFDHTDIYDILPERPPSAHKGDFGKTVIIAGSTGMTGAAAMASEAVLRVGGGLTILGIPSSLNDIMEQKLTEVMTQPLAETPQGSLSSKAKPAINKLFQWADVAVIGPGLSFVPETAELVRTIVSKAKLPLVLDADGINAFEGYASILEEYKKPLVLSPHYGELSRLINIPIQEIAANPIDMARDTAQRFRCTVVLKGAPAVTAHFDGRVFVNSTGNSGMATPGSGDVLTGMIAGLLTQGCTDFYAATGGVYLHGLAGDLAAEMLGERSLIAGDLLSFISDAFSFVEECE